MKHARVSWVVGAACLGTFLALVGLHHSQRRAGPFAIVNARPVALVRTQAAWRPAGSLPTPSPTNLAGASTRVEGKLLSSRDRLWDQPVTEPEFARFREWVKRYRAADAGQKMALAAEGIRLARERRQSLRRWIQSDPARALALAVPAGVRRALPDSVARLLEDSVSGRGSLDVFAALAEPGKENEVTPTFRTATVEGHEYQAFVYGRRLGEPTRQEIALNGVAVDDFLAVNENPLRLLEPEEVASALPSEPLCAISGNPSTINQSQTVAEVGGQPVFLCGLAHAEKLNERLIQAEAAGDTSSGSATVQASSRTEGIKKLLFIRVDFSDLPGAPFADNAGISLISGLNAFYTESSFGRTGFSPYGGGSEITGTLRMPQPASYYGPNNYYTQLRTDARSAAVTAGYVLSNYDFDLICFGPVPGWGWAGLGYVGAAGVWLRNYFSPGVAGHELGHNYGLNHANFWDTGGLSVIGAGTSVEYGDIYDTMGAANAGAYHFNARNKSYLNWLTPGETLTVSTSGVYRLYPHDDTNSTGLRGLKVVRSSTTNYWVEFRQKFTANRWLLSGAAIRWAGNGNERTQLLDTTPGSPDGRNDAALVLGRTFSDKAAGIHLTTLGKGGTTPESLDVAVNLGAFPGNVAPAVRLSASVTSTSSGAPITFSAAASDADGDPLAYYWDFGDGTFGTNGPAASNSWTTSGEYVVRCVVSDMKGAVASDSVIVTVDNPGTYRVSGRVSVGGVPVEGVRISVSSRQMTYTDSDGTYTLPGLPAGSYTVSADRDGSIFSPSGFANPVSVGPSARGIDFGDGGGGGAGGGTVTLSSPLNNAVFTAPADVFLAASATAAAGQSVTRVEFFRGSTKLGEDSGFPYSFTWTAAPAGSYTLTARSTESSGLVVTSAPVAITVTPAAPAITGQPQSQNVAAGGSVTFSATVTGSAPLFYQWRYNGADLAGANNAALSLFNVQPQQAGGYSVRVTNGGGAATSAVATLTVTCSFTLSAANASFGAAGGSDSVSVTSAGGCSWSVANAPGWITITSGNGGSGVGTVNYGVASNSVGAVRSATLGIAGHNYTVTQVAPDLTRPGISITSPVADASLTNAVLLVSGTADDDMGLARVECRVGSGPFVSAIGTTDWSAQLILSPGTNLVSARSVDLSGNVSLTNTRSFFCSVAATLNLAILGQGAVRGATNGQHLQIGRPYKLSAEPAAGCVFSNWTGDLSGASSTINFVMESNLAVTATFVTNPFVGVTGRFCGLFHETNEVRLGCSGCFSFKLTHAGSYTAWLRIGNKKSVASGRLNLEGTATNVIARPGTNALTIVWAMDLKGSDQITGTVGDGNWTAQLLGDRAVFSRTQPAPQAGAYTVILLGTPASTLAPEGDGYGTATVNANGVVRVSGFLADKSAIAGSVSLSKAGHWPLYFSLYGGKGALLGWVTLADRPTTDLDGVLSWIKPPLPTARYYPEGFTSEAALLGSSYTPPAGETNRLLRLTEATVLFSGGNLSQRWTNAVVLGPRSTITNASPNSLAMSFRLSSGLFRGRFLAPDESEAVLFKGVAFQKANYGSGYFLGTNQSGRVSLGAAP